MARSTADWSTVADLVAKLDRRWSRETWLKAHAHDEKLSDALFDGDMKRVEALLADRDVNAYYSIEVPDSLHPMVRTHPVTGRKALFVSPRFTVAIDGMGEAKAQPLLDELFEHQKRPEFIHRKGGLESAILSGSSISINTFVIPP